MADRRSMVRWNRNADMNSVTTSLRLASESLRAQVEDVALDAAEAGADGMREAIHASGRVKTGKMVDAIGTDVDAYDTVVHTYFGWDKTRGDWGRGGSGGGPWEDYFGYQEHGFWHVNAEKWIEGIQAAMHGAQRAKSVMAAGMKRLNLRRKVTRRMQLGFDPDNTRRTEKP